MNRNVILIAASAVIVLFLGTIGVGGIALWAFWPKSAASKQQANEDSKPAPQIAQQRDTDNQKNPSTDQQLLADKIQFVIAVNRHMAATQEISFWSAKVNVPKDIIDNERSLFRRWNEQQRQLKSKWGNTSKSIAQLDPGKSKMVNTFTDGTKKIVAETLIATHQQMRLEHQAAMAKLRADVIASRPLAPGKVFDLTAPGGKIAYEEYKIRQTAEDNLVRAEREEEIARRWVSLQSEIASKWVRKAHEDNQKNIATLEASLNP